MGADEIRKLKADAEKKSEFKQSQKELSAAGLPTELQQWYFKIIRTQPHVCMETGDPISDGYMLASIAHIFAKALFPSVATHTLNYLILNVWGGTHDKSHRWDTFQNMKVWPIALERMILIEPSIAPEERKRIPQFFLDILEQRKQSQNLK